MQAEVITIGDEILIGQVIPNQNTFGITRPMRICIESHDKHNLSWNIFITTPYGRIL